MDGMGTGYSAEPSRREPARGGMGRRGNETPGVVGKPAECLRLLLRNARFGFPFLPPPLFPYTWHACLVGYALA